MEHFPERDDDVQVLLEDELPRDDHVGNDDQHTHGELAHGVLEDHFRLRARAVQTLAFHPLGRATVQAPERPGKTRKRAGFERHRRGGRVVECGGLENRYGPDWSIEGSNPSPSADSRERPA